MPLFLGVVLGLLALLMNICVRGCLEVCFTPRFMSVSSVGGVFRSLSGLRQGSLPYTFVCLVVFLRCTFVYEPLSPELSSLGMFA